MRVAVKLLANLQTDNNGDTIFEGLQEKVSLQITKELRRFIEVDNHEAVNICDQEKNSEAIKVVKLKFNYEISSRTRPSGEEEDELTSVTQVEAAGQRRFGR